MKILITAFEPFMGLNTNSSYEVVKGLKQKSNITKIFLPVKLHESFSILKKHIDEVNPDIIILDNVSGTITRRSGNQKTTDNITARTGLYNRAKETITLRGNVNIDSSNGDKLLTKELVIRL